jgi:succinoglycan biosynthesis transport protein ExoP
VELSGYVAIAKRWLWTLIVATWVAGLSGYLLASQIQPTYETKVRLLVGPINTDIDTLRAAGQLVQTYGELVTSGPLLESTAKELGITTPIGQLQANIKTSADDVTRILTVRVDDSNPDQAVSIAQTLANELIQVATAGTSRPEGELQVIEYPQRPTVPIAPQVSLITLIAGAAGLVGALLVVMIIEYFAGTVRTSADLVLLTSLPFLGLVPIPRAGWRGLMDDDRPNPRLRSALRLLAAKIHSGDGETLPSTLMVLDADDRDADGIVAAGLADVLARSGRDVVLVDRTGVVSRQLGLADRPGIAEWMAGKANPESLVISRTPTLAIVPVGQGSTAEFIDPQRVRSFGSSIARPGRLVIVAGGALGADPSSLTWAHAADAAIIVASRDQTRREAVQSAAETLRLAGVTLAGTVLVEQGDRGGPLGSLRRSRSRRPTGLSLLPVTAPPEAGGGKPVVQAPPADAKPVVPARVSSGRRTTAMAKPVAGRHSPGAQASTRETTDAAALRRVSTSNPTPAARPRTAAKASGGGPSGRATSGR